MPLSLMRIVIARLAGQRRAVAPTLGAFVLATALLVVLPETAYLSASAAFQSFLHSLSTSTSTVQVQGTGLGSDQAIAEFERAVRQRSVTDEHGYLREVSFRVASRSFTLTSHDNKFLPPADKGTVLTFASHSDLQPHADLIAGSWSDQAPSQIIPITLSEAGAKLFNAKPGDSLCVANGIQADAICLSVAGIWRPREATSAYWAGDDSLSNEAEVSRPDLSSLVANSPAGFRATVVLVADLSLIGQSDPAVAQDSLAHLRPQLGGNVPYRQVITDLDAAVSGFNGRWRVATFALQLITAQLWLVGLYCVLFLISIRLEQDRDAVAVLRTRGWPRRLVATLLSVELMAVAALAFIPGAAVGFGLAVAITRAVYPVAQLSIGPSIAAVAPVVLAGLVLMGMAIVALAVFAARASVVRARAEASRPPSRWWSRPSAAALAALVAVPILAEARALGDARLREVGAGLPYDLLLPGVAMALIAFAGIALIPLIANTFALISRGLEARLAAVQLARASSRQQRLSLLIAAAVALALLAAAYSGTAAQNASDRAAYAAGADLRVVTRGLQPTDPQTLSVTGATAKSEVFRSYVRTGAGGGEVPALGVDPYTFASVAWTRPGLMSPDLNTLMRNLTNAEKGGTLLPSTATGISVWVHGQQTGGSLTASFTDANLMPVTSDLGTLDFEGWKQLAGSFAPARFKPPLRLRHLTLTPVTKEGTVAVSDLEATESGARESIAGFDTVHGFPGWWASDGTTGAMLQELQPDERFLRDGNLTAHVFLSPGWLPVTLNPPVIEIEQTLGQLISLPVPVLVSTGLLSLLRVKIGDSISVQLDNEPVNGRIVGLFDYFPTLYGDGLVYSLPLLLQVLGGAGHPRPWPSELWASGSASQLQADEVELAIIPQVAKVISRQDLDQRSAADPLGAAGRANLILGFAAACALAIAAFAIHFALAAKSRTSEYAILQANGLSPGQVARSLVIEQVFIVTFSTLLGLVVGAALSLVLLPALQVSTSLTDTVPPTVLAVNAWLAIAGISVTIVACLLGGSLVARSIRVVDLMQELRALG